MSQPIQILIVEDSADDAELLEVELRRADFDPHWHRVQTESDYLDKLRPDLDLIISDYTMPEFDGIRALELMKKSGYEIPFIFVSGTIGEERAVEAMKRGASDYLIKDRPGRLGSAVSHALEERRLRHVCDKAEQVVSEGERKFRTLFDAAHDAIYILLNGAFVDCNQKGQKMYGRSWEEIVGHTPDEFAPITQSDGQDSRQKAIEIVHNALAGKAQCFDWCSKHVDGSLVYSEVSLNRLEMEGKVYLMAISRDVTERRRAEEKIEEQAALLDSAQDAILVRDLNGKILFWNKGAERMYGWTSEEILGQDVGKLIYADSVEFEETNRRVLKLSEWTGEILNITRDRHELTVETRCTLLRDKEGRPKSVLAINTDVTEKKTIEAQLMRSQRMESIGTLAGGIAHDLNNILTPILTTIELLKLRETDPQTKHMLETIEASSKRAADIVTQVLSFAHGIKGERVEVQIKRLLKDIQILVDQTFPKNIQLAISLPQNLWSMFGDPTRLHEVLLSVCQNARDAMPEGGALSIIAENSRLDRTHAAKYIAAKPGRYVTITIADTGLGIPAPIIDRIFEPFFTTKEVDKGTGLGLSTVLAIVKSHQGFIDVQSKPGKGTSFRIFLPAKRVASELPAKRVASEQRCNSETLAGFPRGNSELILIVDDEAPIRQVASETLEAFGYQTLTARDGAEAVEIYRHKSGKIAAVLTDMSMPIMDGAATIRALLEINPNVKIVASSGYNLRSVSGKTSNIGAQHFLAKPYSAETLLKTVRVLLDEDGQPGQLSGALSSRVCVC